MPAKLNTEAVSKIIKELTDGNFILIGDYKGIKYNIQMKHTKCDSVFEVRLDHFKRGQNCRVCEKPKKENIHFISEVEDLVGTEYRFLEPYQDAITKIRVIHNVCGFEYSVKPANFLVGKRCPKCANNIRSDTEEFISEVFNLVGEEYTVSGEYVNNNTKIDIIHNSCGKTISIRPYSFKVGNRCVHCSGKGVIKYNHESFNELVKDLSEGEYEITNTIKYTKLKSKVEFIHKTCGNKYITVSEYFITGNRCPHCFGNTKKNTDWFVSKVREDVGEEYVVLGEYINYLSKIKIRHSKCNTLYDVTPADFIGTQNKKGKRCPLCYGKTKKTNEEFKIELLNAMGSEYIQIGEYVGSNTKIEILHTVCGETYAPTPANILSGKSRCSCETENRGEFKVKELLDLYSVNFNRQYSHPDCKYISPLRFDFAVYNDLNQLQCLIEYDGKQHHEPIEYFGGEKAFKLQQKKDKIKDDYCKANNIPLIRIPYWDFKNIDLILTERLTELGILSPALIEV